MTKLYSSLAKAYHEMYQTIFDYKKEFQFYDKLLKKYKCKKILEIGCGSGNLAPYFLEADYDYKGLDLFNEMLKIAREIEPKAHFVQSDMRNLRFKNEFDAILITGRSFTYMTKNEDVMRALQSIFIALKKKGILIFDNFNATVVFGDFHTQLVQTAKYNGRSYKRISKNSKNLKNGWTWNWNATYYIKESGKTKVIRDKSILRAFTEDELKLFLKLNNFRVLDMIKEGSAITAVVRKH